LKDIIETWTKTRKKEDVIILLNENGIPCSPIYDIKDITEDPHFTQAREMIVEQYQPGLGTIKLLGNPIKMSDTKPRSRGPAPDLGSDTGEVLHRLLGIREEKIQRLKKRKVIS
jgi:crotonobetainyl-CoA:carnitine CoA-transferase CaiB-like acyl-CoA transferase